MRQSDRWIKIVIVILTLVLISLLGWVAFDLTGSKGDGGYQAATLPESRISGEQNKSLETKKSMEESNSKPASESVSDAGGEASAESAMESATESVTESESVTNSSVTLLFGGDVLLSNHVLNAYDKAGGITGVLDQNLRDEIGAADIFMVNQEFPFSDRGEAVADKQYTFRLPPARVKILKEMEIDLVTLANNHILDFGTDPLLDSQAALDGAGIAYVGAGENLQRAKKLITMEAEGKTIGYLGASRVYMDGSWAASSNRPGVFSTYDPKQLVEEIKAAREQCDYLVVYVHWGIEKDTIPQDYQRTLGQAYIDAGADLVVGSHPHVLQGIEYYKGKPIVYSLGNFVFGSSIPKTALLKVELEESQARLSMIPCTSSAGYTRKITDSQKAAGFFQEMTELSFDVTFTEDGTIR